MKKLVFIVTFVVMFALMSGVAFAETPHGPFDDNTALCAACHRTHTAQDDYLLGQQDITSLCIDCHDSGEGADCDVVNGIYVSDGTTFGTPDKAPDHDDWGANGSILMGGGFMNVQGAGTTTTSKHFNTTNRTLTFNVLFGTGTAPGQSGINGQTSGYMDCVDCHLPHRSTNYRMLRQRPNGTTTALTVTSNLVAGQTHKYTTDVGLFNVKIPVQPSTNDGISEWCGVCHNYYYNNSVATDNDGAARATPFSATYYDIGGTSAADLTYMHAVDADLMYTARNGGNNNDDLSIHLDTVGGNADILPVATDNGSYDQNDRITCLTCHRAHGTEVESGNKQRILSGVTLPAANSTLLRLPKLGVCETCHDMPQGY